MGRTTPAARAGFRWTSAAALVAAFALGIAAALVLGSWVTGPDATQRRIAELQHEEVLRDVAQVEALVELARGGRERLTPVLRAMAQASPPGDAVPPAAPSAEDVRGWREVVAAEVRRYEETPSAGNGVNVARTGMRVAVQQLAAAVDGFAAAVTATGPTARDLLALADAQRALAVRTWSVAALQLDVISVDAGKGHVHVQLPSGRDPGAIPPDTAPEGTR
ncbi:hypothetical protein [Saccharothrix sp. HUAS TT1]|uniref:hypothetical protein n=1 Tax=unclassified Saccharothrix TaxID=2593673 RepID=UPI00345C391C